MALRPQVAFPAVYFTRGRRSLSRMRGLDRPGALPLPIGNRPTRTAAMQGLPDPGR